MIEVKFKRSCKIVDVARASNSYNTDLSKCCMKNVMFYKYILLFLCQGYKNGKGVVTNLLGLSSTGIKERTAQSTERDRWETNRLSVSVALQTVT